MKNKKYLMRAAGLVGLILGLTACGTTGTGSGTATNPSPNIEAELPMVRTSAAVAAGGVLDFAVQPGGARLRLANEMYAAAKAVYSLTDGPVPTPAQLETSLEAFGGAQTDAGYMKFATTMSALYAAYYPKLTTGNAQAATELLNAMAGGIEDATRAYVTTPVVVASAEETVSF